MTHLVAAPSEAAVNPLILVAAFVTLLALVVPALGAVQAPKVVSEHTPDLHSLADFVASVVKPEMSQKERAHALWQAVADKMLSQVRRHLRDSDKQYELTSAVAAYLNGMYCYDCEMVIRKYNVDFL